MADNKSKSLELKVGIFVFAGLVILTWFVLLIGDFKIIKHGYHIKVTFSFANGIKVGAPLRLAGVDVGEVKEIRLTHDENGNTTVFLTAWLDSEMQVPKNSRAWVNTLGLLGEKYLEIIPGKDFTVLLKEGDVIKGEDPTSVQEVTDMMKDIAIQAKGTLASMDTALTGLNEVLGGKGTVGKFLTDDKLYVDLEEMFADLKKNPWKLLYRPKGVQ